VAHARPRWTANEVLIGQVAPQRRLEELAGCLGERPHALDSHAPGPESVGRQGLALRRFHHLAELVPDDRDVVDDVNRQLGVADAPRDRLAQGRVGHLDPGRARTVEPEPQIEERIEGEPGVGRTRRA
jgi:hypothetical protein